MLFAKLFPMVSIWETREDDAEREAGRAVAPAPQPAPQRWGSIPIILIACVLVGATHARAAEPPETKKPQATVLSMEWRTEVASKPTTSKAQSRGGTGWVESFLDHFFAWRPDESDDRIQNPPTFVVTAKLLDAKGQPVTYQPVDFKLKTSFGTLDYGSRPTNAEGKAELRMQDQRYGQYPVETTYDGGAQFAAAHAVTSVDFGPRPEISLPPEGVLITPYPTAGIALPFVFFYGLMWVVFFYVGYLIIWRLRKIRRHQR
jgi:hypothetical protein